jgi:hypothetical protein
MKDITARLMGHWPFNEKALAVEHKFQLFHMAK